MKHPPRLPYCGTCKTMGERYGQHTRLLLNHDTVFLAELLLEYGVAPEWSAAYRSFNCMSMPQAHAIPPALDFAAAATVVLAHYRIEDHRADSGRRWWTWAARLLSPSYRKASEHLRDLNFPLEQLAEILETQGEREATARCLEDVAEPTAAATAMFFAHGAQVVQREDLSEQMHRVGHRFGFLIYTLDAWEDRARDAKRGDFNALLRFPDVDGRAEVLAATAALEREIPPGLAIRLRANVEERLCLRPRVLMHRCRKSAREKWRDAVAVARALRKEEGVLIFAAGCLAAYLAPHQMRSAESLRHGLGLAVNLMALGAVLSSAIPPPPPPPPPHGGAYRPNVAIPPGRTTSACGNICQCCNCCCTAECCAEGCCEGCCSIGECCSGCSC